MRYRPFGKSGMALSTVGLRLDAHAARKGAGHVEKLIITALENGINAYMFDWADAKLLHKAAEVLSVVERHILFVGISAADVTGEGHPNYSLEALRNRLKPVIRDSGLQWIDILQFNDPDVAGLPDETLDFADSLRRARMVRQIGVRSDIPSTLAAAIRSRRFQVIETAFDIDSTWDKRRLMDGAATRDMSVFGSNFFPQAYMKASDVVPKEAKAGFFGMGRAKNPLAGAGSYAFLHQTPNWTAEQLCLGYALSQPSLSCIFLDVESPDHLNDLAEVAERDMPSSVPAQIEMARFSEGLKARA